MYTFQALQILIFLIPGFISATILTGLIVRKEQSEFGRVIEALIFSMLVYTLYSFVFRKSPISVDTVKESIRYSYDFKSFLWLSSVSIGLPIVLSLFVTNDWHMKIARKVGLTRKTARSTVWFDVFCDVRKHIIVNFENGRRIFGWPQYYSEYPDSPYIYLHKPAWIYENPETQESESINLDEDGILITPEQKIESIEFLDS